MCRPDSASTWEPNVGNRWCSILVQATGIISVLTMYFALLYLIQSYWAPDALFSDFYSELNTLMAALLPPIAFLALAYKKSWNEVLAEAYSALWSNARRGVLLMVATLVLAGALFLIPSFRPPETLLTRLTRAIMLYRQDEASRVIAEVSNSKRYGHVAPMWRAIYNVWFGSGSWYIRAQELRTCSELGDTEPLYHYSLGQCYANLGLCKKAMYHFDRVQRCARLRERGLLGIFGNRQAASDRVMAIMVNRKISFVLERQGQIEAALRQLYRNRSALFEKGAFEGPQWGDVRGVWLNQIAALETEAGHYRQSATDYGRLERWMDDPNRGDDNVEVQRCETVYYNIGRVQLYLGKPREARIYFDKAVETKPDFAYARLCVAVVEMLEGNTTGAADMLGDADLASAAKSEDDGRASRILRMLRWVNDYRNSGRILDVAVPRAQRQHQLLEESAWLVREQHDLDFGFELPLARTLYAMARQLGPIEYSDRAVLASLIKPGAHDLLHLCTTQRHRALAPERGRS